MAIVGLADKAVAESRERVRAALASIGLALPPKRIAVNLAPADVLKEGAHFDLPIALGLMVAMGVVPRDAVEDALVLGELALDGAIQPVSGALPAAIAAVAAGRDLICPHDCGSEAARQFGARRNTGIMRTNADMGIDQLDQQITMDDAAQDLLRTAMDQANLSARAYHKIMRVSRTIADLSGDDRVGRAALAAALAYRTMPLLA
jgi:predicted ATPase with chaperone activity